MSLVLELALVPVLLLVSLCFLGFGITRLLVPESLSGFRHLLMPFIGFCFLVTFFSALNLTVLNLEQCTIAVLVAAIVINGYAVSRCRELQALRAGISEAIGPAFLFVLVYLISVIPLINYGHTGIIGANGDAEQYLATAEYLRQFAVPALDSAAPNPLRDLTIRLASDFSGGMGFSYALAYIATIMNVSALNSFAPTMGFFVAAGAVAVYVFARASLMLPRVASVLVGVILGLNSLVLWTGFFNYGRQIAVLPLLPVTAVLFAACVKKGDWRSLTAALMLLVGVFLTYGPAGIWLSSALSLYLLITALARFRRGQLAPSRRTLMTVAVVPILASVFTLVQKVEELIQSVPEGEVFSSNSLPEIFLPLSHLFGLSYYVWPEPNLMGQGLAPILVDTAIQFAPYVAIICAGLAILGLWHTISVNMLMPISLTVSSAVLLGTLRLMGDRYSYFKAITFSVFLATVLLVVGIVVVWTSVTSTQRRDVAVAVRCCLIAVFVSALFVVAINTYSTVHHFFEASHSAYVEQRTALCEADNVIQKDASVFLTDDPSLQGWGIGVYAFCLMPRPVYGDVTLANPHYSIGYSGANQQLISIQTGDVDSVAETILADYALLASKEDPVARGYELGKPVWKNGEVNVFESGRILAHARLVGENGFSAITAHNPLRARVEAPINPLRSRDWVRSSSQGTLSGHSLAFETWSLSRQDLTVTVGQQVFSESIEAGLWRFETPLVSLPTTVGISAEGSEPLFMNWMQVRQRGPGEPKLERAIGYTVIEALTGREATTLTADLTWVGPASPAVPGFLELRVTNAEEENDSSLLASGCLTEALQRASVAVDLEDASIAVTDPGSELPLSKWKLPNHGDYVLEARVAYVDQDEPDPRQVVELATLTVDGGKIVDAQASGDLRTNVYHSSASWQDVSAQFGDVAKLIGYSAADKEVRFEGDAEFSLYWEVPKGFARDWRVLTELVDANGLSVGQRDLSLKSARVFGAESIGGSTQILRSDHVVPLDRAAVSGDLRVNVQMYSPATSRVLRLVGGDQADEDHLQLSGFRVLD